MKLPRRCDLWLPGYLRSQLRFRMGPRPRRVWLLLADHYEPFWRNTDEAVASSRVEAWSRAWPEIASGIVDSAGRKPVYTFFYPEEEYRPHLLDALTAMAEAEIADVEIHLHHDNEGEQNFVDRISWFAETLRNRHGLLRLDEGKATFGFIHGNWALDNSDPEGRHCGLNNELTLLTKLGCYADFTLPSVPYGTQTQIVNTIYWAVDDPTGPKSHNTGIPVEQSPERPAGALMMIPGPLGVRSRLLGYGDRLAPRIERGELGAHDMPTPDRVDLWIDVAPRIGEDVFIKLYAHGTQERHSASLLSTGLKQTLELMSATTKANGQELYFASAWEMKLAIDALRQGADPVAAVASPSGRATPSVQAQS